MQNKKHISEDYISAFLKNTQHVTEALQAGIDTALLKHKQAGNPVCEWQDGKVVWISPDKIPVRREN